MNPVFLPVGVWIVLTIFFFICTEIGHRYGIWRFKFDPETSGLATVDSAVFALVGLLLAFSLSSAQDRFQNRRIVIVKEANCISTAFLRTDLIPSKYQFQLRQEFGKYVDSRITATGHLPNIEEAQKEWVKSHLLGRKIWDLAVEGTNGSGHADRNLVLDSINSMLDVATEREVAVLTHIPTPIFVFQGFLTAIAAMFAGRSTAKQGKKPNMHRLLFSVIFATLITILVDLENPRIGWIQLTTGDTVMRELQQTIHDGLVTSPRTTIER